MKIYNVKTKEEDILKLLFSGKINDLDFSPHTSRMTLLKKYGELKGINKKNGVYEMLIKDNMLFLNL